MSPLSPRMSSKLSTKNPLLLAVLIAYSFLVSLLSRHYAISLQLHKTQIQVGSTSTPAPPIPFTSLCSKFQPLAIQRPRQSHRLPSGLHSPSACTVAWTLCPGTTSTIPIPQLNMCTISPRAIVPVRITQWKTVHFVRALRDLGSARGTFSTNPPPVM